MQFPDQDKQRGIDTLAMQADMMQAGASMCIIEIEGHLDKIKSALSDMKSYKPGLEHVSKLENAAVKSAEYSLHTQEAGARLLAACSVLGVLRTLLHGERVKP